MTIICLNMCLQNAIKTCDPQGGTSYNPANYLNNLRKAPQDNIIN